MKHILTFLFCISLLTGCVHGRHEAIADGHMVNDGKAPQQTVSINNLYPGELPDTGKVTTYHGPAIQFWTIRTIGLTANIITTSIITKDILPADGTSSYLPHRA